jgi:RND family efflux transporter MFP subunit
MGPRLPETPNSRGQRKNQVTQNALKRLLTVSCLVLVGFSATGCQKKPAAAAGPQMQGLPVQTVTVAMQPVAQSSEYVATVKSRRSATMQPQVSGSLTEILVRSGDHVKSGQVLMAIDPRQQQAMVESQRATEQQKKALFDYNAVEVSRQQKLFEAGVTSRDAYDQAQQAYQNAKADYESAAQSRKSQEQLLAYYTIRSPFDGVVGDIPVHVGDYVTTSTVLTTVDENKDLEAYIYVPTERSSQVRMGQNVDLTDNNGKLLEKTKVDFVSPQVDSTLQEILVKAPIDTSLRVVRNAEMVKADVIWSTKPMAVVPVLAVTRQGEESFVYVVQQQGPMTIAHRTSVVLGDTVGNNYSIASGLNTGDRVVVSGTQFLVDGMPVILMGGPPQPPPPAAKGAGAQSMNSGAQPDQSSVKRVAVSHSLHRKHRKSRARRHGHVKPVQVS